MYSKLEISLNVEFKPDETPFTQLLRDLGAKAIAHRLESPDIERRKQTVLQDFFSTLATEFFGPDIPGSLNPEIIEYIREMASSDMLFEDPALARVVSIAKFKKDPFILNLPANILAGFMYNHHDIFSGGDNQTDGFIPKETKWRIVDRDDETARLEEALGTKYTSKYRPDGDGEGVDDEEYTPEFLTEIDPVLGVDLAAIERAIKRGVFNVRLANCRNEKAIEAVLNPADDGEDEKDLEVATDDQPPINIQDLLFLTKGQSADELDEGKKICNSCPVRTVCLAYAVSENMRKVIWGGQSDRSRGKIRKALADRRKEREKLEAAEAKQKQENAGVQLQPSA